MVHYFYGYHPPFLLQAWILQLMSSKDANFSQSTNLRFYSSISMRWGNLLFLLSASMFSIIVELLLCVSSHSIVNMSNSLTITCFTSLHLFIRVSIDYRHLISTSMGMNSCSSLEFSTSIRNSFSSSVHLKSSNSFYLFIFIILFPAFLMVHHLFYLYSFHVYCYLLNLIDSYTIH